MYYVMLAAYACVSVSVAVCCLMIFPRSGKVKNPGVTITSVHVILIVEHLREPYSYVKKMMQNETGSKDA